MASKKLKTLDIKKITRITNIGVLLFSAAIIVMSGWFLTSALDEERPAVTIDKADGLGIETIDLRLLEKVIKNLADKRSGGEDAPARTRNPFIGNVPAPEPQPQPVPRPVPAPPPSM